MGIKEIIEKLRLLLDPDSKLTMIASLGALESMSSETSKIIISIANIEEDPILKNASIYEREKDSNGYRNIIHPKKHLILSLIFSSSGVEENDYLEGLIKLQDIIQFFQDNRLLYYSKTDFNDNLLIADDYNSKAPLDKENYLPLQIDSESMSFDQLNQMWSYFGAKYMPSVLYKVRFLPVTTSKSIGEGIIENVRIEHFRRSDNAKKDLPLLYNEYTYDNL